MEDESENEKILWDFEKKNPEAAKRLKDQLRNVMDPELGYSVIELGLIRDVIVETAIRVILTMILTTPFCPYAAELVEQVRMAAEDELQICAVVDLRLEPWDASMMEEGLDDNWGLY